MRYSKFIYRLGGATYDVIKHCSADTRTKYSNLAYSLLLSTVLAAIGGFDIARQFTTLMAFCFGVAILWGVAVFSFDFFLLNGGIVNGFFKYIRIPVGLANVFITITALFVLLNQSTIDTNIRLANASKISKCDSTYLSGKEERYAQVDEQKKHIDEYHQKNCVPEALNGHPGPEYDRKHSLCITTNTEIAQETAKLDSTEKTYVTAYQTEKEALQGITSNDFFAKAKLLPGILSANILILVLAICLFIFLGYIELQSILMKFAIDPNDEYHINLRKYNADRRGLVASKMDNETSVAKDKILLDKKVSDESSTKEKFEADMKAIDALAVRELEVKGKIDILREYGYDATAANLEELWKQYVKTGSASQDDTSDIFKMSQSMAHQVEEIKKVSTNENLSENVFNWVLTNITYDTGHSKEHYRTAKETYNEKRGLCGELSVLYMSFLRVVNIDCYFCEVTKDNTGKEVAHACIIIKNNDGKAHLSDVAYKAFTIEHIEYRELTDAELKTKYDNWNQ
jgi:Transglutaminase-like superfamily